MINNFMIRSKFRRGKLFPIRLIMNRYYVIVGNNISTKN